MPSETRDEVSSKHLPSKSRETSQGFIDLLSYSISTRISRFSRFVQLATRGCYPDSHVC